MPYTMVNRFGGFVIVAACIVVLAVALHTLLPFISGHVAMGLATAVLLLVGYVGRFLGVGAFD